MDHPAYQSTQTPPVSNLTLEPPTTEPQPNASSIPPQIPKSKNWKKWIVIVGITLVTLLTGTAYVLSQQESKKSEPPTKQLVSKPSPTPDPTTDWKTYIGKMYKFSYPDDWTIKEELNNTCEDVQPCYVATLQNPTKTITIIVSSGHRVFSIGAPATITSSTRKIAIQGKLYDAEEVNYDITDDKEASFIRLSMSFDVSGKKHYLEAISDQGTQAISDYKEALALNTIQNILQTFKFTDQAPISRNPQTACEQSGGKWLAQYNECEAVSGGLDEKTCKELGGVHKTCDSACRHDPNAQGCIDVCINVCKF
jgi:hypothetical protein